VGAAALVGSGITGYLAASDNSKLGQWVGGSNPSASASDVSGLRSNINTEAWISTAALGVGVVAVGVGVMFLIIDRPKAIPATPGGGS
jgi:hypothetical protein